MILQGVHVVVVPLLALLTLVDSQSVSGCTTPDGVSGQCTHIIDCPPLLNLQRQLQANRAPPGSLGILRKSVCENKNGVLYVCCQSTEPTNRRLGVLPSECGRRGLADRIINGENAVLFGWPWIALLEARDVSGRRVFVCGGVLISDRYILTAAHCLNEPRYTVNRVRLGEHTISSNPDCVGSFCAPPHQIIGVEETIIHEGYKTLPDCRDCHDIALIRLNRRVEFNRVHVNAQKVVLNVQPICLPQNLQRDLGFSQNEFQSRQPWIAGWGITEHGVGSNVLQEVQLKINSAACPFLHVFPDPNMVLCVEENGKGTCHGDSGGPMVMANKDGTYYLIGIVTSGAKECAASNSGGRYTSVSYYVPWITKKLR